MAFGYLFKHTQFLQHRKYLSGNIDYDRHRCIHISEIFIHGSHLVFTWLKQLKHLFMSCISYQKHLLEDGGGIEGRPLSLTNSQEYFNKLE